MQTRAQSKDPRKSDEPALRLEDFIPYRLNRASEAVSRRFSRVYRDRYGMTRPEWRAFATIGQFGTVTATEIGRHSSMHKTKVSRAVLALEKRAWLVRNTDPNDRRIEHLSLTAAGRSAYSDMVSIAREFENRMMSALGAQSANMLANALDALERTGDTG